METQNPNEQKSMWRLTSHVVAILAMSVISAAACSNEWLGVMVTGDTNHSVVFAAEIGGDITPLTQSQTEDGTTKGETPSLSADQAISGAVAGATKTAIETNAEAETNVNATVYAGAQLELSNALTAAVTETKNPEDQATLGDEGVGSTGDSPVEGGLETDVKEETSSVEPAAYECTNTGWVTAASGVNVRAEATVDAEAIGKTGYGQPINYATTGIDGWYAVESGDGVGFVSSDYVSDNFADTATSYDCSGNHRKSYMSYHAIGGGKQYRLQSMAYTEMNGVRAVDGRYCIAIGQSYGAKIGTYVDVELSDGTLIPCVVGDAKANRDTKGGSGYVGADGSIVEFIVDTPALPSAARSSGDCSSINGWGAQVSTINVYPTSAL